MDIGAKYLDLSKLIKLTNLDLIFYNYIGNIGAKYLALALSKLIKLTNLDLIL